MSEQQEQRHAERTEKSASPNQLESRARRDAPVCALRDAFKRGLTLARHSAPQGDADELAAREFPA